MVKLIQLPFPDLYSPPLSSFSFSVQAHQEAIPLPLRIVFLWERDILHENISTFEILFKWACLCCIWASLRFGDAQHVDWSRLMLDNNSLRSISFRTKTSRTGMPWGIMPWGLSCSSSAEIQGIWAYKWLAALDSVWLRANQSLNCHVQPDFLFCALTPDDCLSGPMSYASALKHLRQFIRVSLVSRCSHEQLLSFSLHSCKCTLLSWSAQNLEPAE